jgi:hypothetical protein
MKIKVHSGDPVKKYVVALIKKKTNCSKVTSVLKIEGSTFKFNDGFYGSAHHKILNSRSYVGQGACFVSEQELHDEYPDIFLNPKYYIKDASLVDKYNVSGDLFIKLTDNKIPNQGITELSNELGLNSTEASQTNEMWTTRGAK